MRIGEHKRQFRRRGDWEYNKNGDVIVAQSPVRTDRRGGRSRRKANGTVPTRGDGILRRVYAGH